MGKLVRDRIPEIIRENGGDPITHRASAPLLRAALIDKLHEEVEEFCQASGRSAIMEELADILEVVYALGGSYGSELELIEINLRKRQKRGGFDHGIIWEGNK